MEKAEIDFFAKGIKNRVQESFFDDVHARENKHATVAIRFYCETAPRFDSDAIRNAVRAVKIVGGWIEQPYICVRAFSGLS